MTSNLERFKKDLKSLSRRGDELLLTMKMECYRDEFLEAVKQLNVNDVEGTLQKLPFFRKAYQSWYSEAKAVVRQLLPDRLVDFVSYYERPKRKDITYSNYRIVDYLEALAVTHGNRQIVGPNAALPQFEQQLAIFKSVEGRFESSLYDIRQIVQADLFASDLDAADELAKHKFTRASGAMTGVVLERHLKQVCENHQIKVTKPRPTISDLNNALKEGHVIDVPQWRFIQHLADIRNLCDHNKATEPTVEQVNDLLNGVRKVTKAVF